MARPSNFVILAVVPVCAVVSTLCSPEKADTKKDAASGTIPTPEASAPPAPQTGTLDIGFSDTNIPPITSTIQQGIPASYRTGGTLILASLRNALLSFPSPPISSELGSPPSAGNLLDFVWDSDESQRLCNEANLSSPDCLRSRSGSVGVWRYYNRPRALTDPSICRAETSLEDMGGSVPGRACNFESFLVNNGKSVDKCFSSKGKTIDMTRYIPWIAEWGLPSNLVMQGSIVGTMQSEKSVYFGVNPAMTGRPGATVVALGSYLGGNIEAAFFDNEARKFTWFHASHGNGSTPMILAFAGEIPDAQGEGIGKFEALRIAEYVGQTHKVVTRLRSEGHYIWVQSWQNVIPGVDGFDASTPNLFNDDECLKLADNLASSTYVDQSECFSAFGKTSKQEMDADDNYRLKLSGNNIRHQNWATQENMWNPDVNPMGEDNTCFEE